MRGSPRTILALGVLLAAIATGLDCTNKVEPSFGPPPPTETSVAAGIIGGGVATAGVGTGGAGGSAQGAGGSTAAPQDCICALNSVSNATCSTCVGTMGAAPNTCSVAFMSCQADQACSTILTCIKAQDCTTGACVAACLGASSDLWSQYEDCVCNACLTECNPPGATCP